MTQAATRQTPLGRMLEAFPDAHQRRNGWWAHDDNPRFDFLETPEGDIRIHSHTGRTVDDILSMGRVRLNRGALYAKPGQSSQVIQRDKLDLLTFAEYMRIDWRFLFNEGCEDGYIYEFSSGDKVICVKLGGCFTPEGIAHTKHQVRVSLNGKSRFYWNQNTYGDILPFGLHHLDWARAARCLFIGEGNSDYLTMAFHRLPFIGIPGADQAKTLDVELLKDIPTIYILEEPDQAQKSKRSGQGFYKNVRQRLREGGYTGDIYAIRFMEATGFKDPSDLHKAIYAQCKEQAEGSFRTEVHTHFLTAIEQAMQQAMPEGNDSLFPVAQARDWSKISFEEFSRLVWKAPAEFLSPIQKMIVCYLFLYMKEVEPSELGWQIDAEKMAPEVGLRGPKGAKTLRKHLYYLHQKLGILGRQQRAVKEYLNEENEEREEVRYKGTEIFYAPRPNFYTPTSYCVVTADQHQPGGPREKQEGQKAAPDLSRVPTKCDYCGSTNVRPYAAECLNPDCCGHVTYPTLQEDDPLPMEKVIESTLSKCSTLEHLETEFQNTIESPVEPVEDEQGCVKLRTPILKTVSNEEKQETIPDDPKMGTSNIDSVTRPQNGYVGNYPTDCTPEDETIPTWCQPNSSIWSRMVERYGQDETIRRARNWFRDNKKPIPPGILREQVAV